MVYLLNHNLGADAARTDVGGSVAKGGQGVKGMRPRLMSVDEIASAEALAAEAMSGLRERVAAPRFMPCPFCHGGVSVSKYSAAWGHVCWICAGWAVVPAEKQYLRGPIAPHPRRQIR